MGTKIATIPTSDTTLNFFYAVKFNHRYTLMTDVSNGLWAWNNTTGIAYRVHDYIPTLTDKNGNPGINSSACSPAPGGHYLTMHKNRLFMANPETSEVAYCGTRQDLTVDISGTVRAMRPFETWNWAMDITRANPGYGGRMTIGDTNQRLTGLWSTEAGLLVFKERSIYLWAWPDSAAPHEVELGASVSKIIDGIGCVAHNTIQQSGTTVFFFGSDANQNYGVYALDGVDIVDITEKTIRDNMRSLGLNDARARQPVAILFDGYYFLAPQVEGKPKLMFAFSIKNDAWIRFEGVSPKSLVVDKLNGKLLILKDEDGAIYNFPNYGDYLDFGTEEIAWNVVTGSITADDPLSDRKWRKLWINADSMDGNVISNAPLDIEAKMVYSDGNEEITTVASGRDIISVDLNHRAAEAQAALSGTADNGLRIRDIALGWRERRLIND